MNQKFLPTLACLCLLLLPHLASAQDDASVLYFPLRGFQTDDVKYEKGCAIGDPILRELIRQTVAMTAREEFALTTRDEALLEPLDTDSEHQIDVRVDIKKWQSLEVDISHQAKKESLFKKRYPLQRVNRFRHYRSVFTNVAPMIREALIPKFEELGFKPQPLKKVEGGHAAVSNKQIESLLAEMNYISQLHAARLLHREIRDEGESFERLESLVRAYSNLHQLTQYTLDSRSWVFAARAMLYCGRIWNFGAVAVESFSAPIYCLTMAGYPGPVSLYTHSLKKALKERLTGAESKLPTWYPIVEAYRNHDFGKLKTMATGEGEHRQLAAVLLMISARHSFGVSLVLQTGELTTDLYPDCLLLTDIMTKWAGVHPLHKLTRVRPLCHAKMLNNHLGDWVDVPKEVKEFLESGPDLTDLKLRAQLAQRFLAAADDDTAEPSWAAVGRGIEAANLVHILELGKFLKRRLGVDPSAAIDAAEVAFKDHPYAPVFRTLRLRSNRRWEDYQSMLNDFDYKVVGSRVVGSFLQSLPDGLHFKNTSVAKAKKWEAWSYVSNESYNADMHRRKFDRWSKQEALLFKKIINYVSPNSPLSYAALMKHEFEGQREEIDIIADEKDHPTVILLAARAYHERSQLREAVQLFNRYLEKTPALPSFLI